MNPDLQDPNYAEGAAPLPPKDAAPWPASLPPTDVEARTPSARLFGAIFLIAAGIALFLNNIGLLPVENIWHYWPLLLVAVGLGKFLGTGSNKDRSWGVIQIVFGVLFLGSNLHWFSLRFSDATWLVGLLLVAVGVASLAGLLDPFWTLFHLGRQQRRHPFGHRQRFGGFPQPHFAPGTFTAEGVVSERLIQEDVVFGAVKRRVTSDAFAGGSVQCVFSSVEIDLRLAAAPAGTASLLVHCTFGSIKLLIPPNWRISSRIAGGFGLVEDKTLPLTRADVSGPILILNGTNVFGSIEIVN